MKKIRLTHTLILLCLLSTPGQTDTSAPVNRSWHFNVFLDDTPIGRHHFELEENGQQTRVTGKARFNVKLLGFTVYSYHHDSLEQWQNGCLREINTTTNDNGEALSVRGQLQRQQFAVQTTEHRHQYPACVRTFAYWNPDYLRAGRLLNTQTGELVTTQLTDLGETSLALANQPTITARHYRLSGKDLQIELWYTRDKQWVALESVTTDGKRIRYQLQ